MTDDDGKKPAEKSGDGGGFLGRAGRALRDAIFEGPVVPPDNIEDPGSHVPVADSSVNGSSFVVEQRVEAPSSPDPPKVDPNVRAKIEQHVFTDDPNSSAASAAYRAFVKNVDTLKAYVPDEGTRTAAALATLSTQGVKPEDVVVSVTAVISSVEGYGKKLVDDLDAKWQGTNDAGLAKKNAIGTKITDLRERIRVLEGRVKEATAEERVAEDQTANELGSISDLKGRVVVTVAAYVKPIKDIAGLLAAAIKSSAK